MNLAAKFSVISLAILLLASPSQAGGVRGLPAGQAVYYNGYYGVAPSYAYAAPRPAYYAPASPVRQVYYPNGVAVTPSARVAYYAPPPNYGYAGYAPPSAYYAPATPGYALSPAGGATQGAEAYAYYGQQTPLNYIPPTFRYQTRIVQVPVTYYRPVTVYDPVTAVPTTCQRASTGTQCQPSRFRLFSWFHSSSACAGGSCAPATGCAAPYYSTVPAVTVPATVVPVVPSSPRGFNNILTPRTTVPAPGTGIISPGVTVPGADIRPSLPPNTIIPNSSIPGSAPSFNPSPPSSFGTGTSSGYAPEISTPAFGSNFRSSGGGAPQSEIQLKQPPITEPGSRRSESTLRPVPDPEGSKRVKPGSRAPQLLNPGDRTAQTKTAHALGTSAWAVVPATWPEKPPKTSHEVNFKVQAAPQNPVPAVEEAWDDSGWKSARQ